MNSLRSAAATHAQNRRRYDLLWQAGGLIPPQNWPQWQLVQRFLGEANLELGPGAHPRLPVLDNHFLEISQAAVTRLNAAGGWAQRSDLSRPFPFPDDHFDLIVAFEILEHLPNDNFVRREIKRCLKPNGAVLVSFPLDQRRWTAYDTLIGHVRRYEVAALPALFQTAGLEIEAATVPPSPALNPLTGNLLAGIFQKYPQICAQIAAGLARLPWSAWLKKSELRPWTEAVGQQLAQAGGGLFLLRRIS